MRTFASFILTTTRQGRCLLPPFYRRAGWGSGRPPPAFSQLRHGPPSLFTLEPCPLRAFKDFAVTFVCVIFCSGGRKTRKWEGSSPSSIPSLGLPTHLREPVNELGCGQLPLQICPWSPLPKCRCTLQVKCEPHLRPTMVRDSNFTLLCLHFHL